MLLILSYIVVGTIGAIYLRWTSGDDGFDLLLDVLLWPLLLYYWMRRRAKN